MKVTLYNHLKQVKSMLLKAITFMPAAWLYITSQWRLHKVNNSPFFELHCSVLLISHLNLFNVITCCLAARELSFVHFKEVGGYSSRHVLEVVIYRMWSTVNVLGTSLSSIYRLLALGMPDEVVKWSLLHITLKRRLDFC